MILDVNGLPPVGRGAIGVSRDPRESSAPMDLVDRVRRALSGRYLIERELGRGGMGVVYLAQDSRHARQVAVKVLQPEAAGTFGLERFLREIEIEASLTHPHILPLHDSGLVDGLLYFVMPFVQGPTLRERIDQGPLPWTEAVAIAKGLASALTYAHERGVIHRDVKPENVLLSEGHALLGDFGIARLLGGPATGGAPAAGGAGTVAYMSPEQADGTLHLDPRTDVYSLGCVTYEMLTGQRPFTGSSPYAVMVKHCHAPRPEASDVRADVPRSVSKAVTRAMAVDGEDRFVDARAFAAALTDARELRRAGTKWKTWPSPVAVVVTCLAALAPFIGSALAERLPWSATPSVVPNARRSILIQVHRTALTTPEEQGLAQDVARALTQYLRGWDEIRAVDAHSLAGIAFDMGLEGFVRSDLDESLALSRQAGVETLVALTSGIVEGVASIEATRVDVAAGLPMEGAEPIVVAGPVDDVQGLVIPIAAQLLGVAGAPAGFPEVRETTSLTAFKEYLAGIDLVEQWRLEGAAERLLASLAADSTFARAHYHLGLTRYWQIARDPGRRGLQPEARRHAAAALRYSATLSARDRRHMEAFSDLTLGDFADARDAYRLLVAGDSTDAYAWSLLGTVEYTDPATIMGRDGVPEARGSLETAARSFLRAVRLRPDFSLGYSYLFDIYRGLPTTPNDCVYSGFWRPEDVGATAVPDPERLLFLCAVATDSLAWHDQARVESLDPGAVSAGAEEFFERAYRELERWHAFAPASPRPLEEMSNWHRERRRRLRDAAEKDLMAGRALTFFGEALAIRGDTLPEDLARLAALRLEAGETRAALASAEQAIERLYADGRAVDELPEGVANAFIAAGRLERALEIAETQPFQNYAQTSSGEVVAYAADGLVNRMLVLGSMGVTGVRLTAAADSIRMIWSRRGYDAPTRAALARSALAQVTAALAQDSTTRARWLAEMDTLPALWAAFDEPDHERAVLLRRRAEEQADDASAPTRFALGLLARKGGDLPRAAEHFSAVRQQRPGGDALTGAWGLRTLALVKEAAVREELGRSAEASRLYSTFLERWAGADQSLDPLLEAARAGLSRTGRQTAPGRAP